ncbi:MAG: DUF4321 domain-containing protein [Dictyoglomus sp.]|nr:DUF4321 domain-containing protein [Dictyoglomus sp.]MCX7845005.1 DUF4321 domain-containing protein [Dictyoglomaceae bacterium]MDW8187742.1 DUF4321 domain-containing protein [Dictyoglomus sp.]
MRRNKWSIRLLIFLLILGVIIGGVIAEALKDKIPILTEGINIGFSPWTLDLYFINLTFGLNLRFNLGSAIGILLVLIFYSI